MPSSSAAYWVGAFSLSEAELGATPPGAVSLGETSVGRAMRSCSGLLLVVDEGSSAFSRLWCCAEMHLALNQRDVPALFDLAATHTRGATLLADGLTAEDGPGGSAWMQKIRREAAFPIHRLRQALAIDVEAALTTNEADRQHLLASLARHGVTPTNLSQQLRVVFASAAWRQAIEKDLSPFRAELIKSVGDYVAQRQLKLNFAGCSDFFKDSHLEELVGVLAASLQSLELGFYACTQITNGGLITLGRHLPKSLEWLRLDFWWCQSIGDWGVRGLAEGFPQGLKQLALRFEDCHLIGNEGVSWLSERFSPTLTELDLNFWNCPRIDDRGVSQLAADLPSGLVSLSLTFYCFACTPARGRGAGITDVGLLALVKALPPGLQSLSLAFVFCDISSEGAEEFAAALPKDLERISLDFRGCSKISKPVLTRLAGCERGAGRPKPVAKGRTGDAVPSESGGGKAAVASANVSKPASEGKHPVKRVIDMFRKVDVAESGIMQRRHLFCLLQLLHPTLVETQFDLLIGAAGLPLGDAVPYEKLLIWLYNAA